MTHPLLKQCDALRDMARRSPMLTTMQAEARCLEIARLRKALASDLKQDAPADIVPIRPAPRAQPWSPRLVGSDRSPEPGDA